LFSILHSGALRSIRKSAVEAIYMIKYCNQDMYIPLCIIT